MENMRVPARIVSGRRTTDGAGVSLVRVFGYHDVKDFDPFLMLDAFDSKDPADYVKGFPWHPHRGIETITYLISGEMEHGDSLGNRGTIRDGRSRRNGFSAPSSGSTFRRRTKCARRSTMILSAGIFHG